VTLQNRRLLIAAINFLVVLGSISVNIYLPSLPNIEKVFSTSISQLKMSITLFLIGYAVSQFFWGSISERFGRKPPIIWGLSLACVGSLIAMLSQDVVMLDIARFIEGSGIGCATVLGRSILSDAFNRNEISRASSFMVICTNIIPALAPLLGGFLLFWFGWRAIFLFLVLYTGFVLLLFILKIPETHPNIKKEYNIRSAIKEYLEVIKNVEFLWYLLPYTMLTGGLIAYYTATPFIFVTTLHLSPHYYSFYSFATVGAFIIGAYFSSSISKWLGFDQTILAGIGLCLCSGVLFIVWGSFSRLGIPLVLIPMAVYSIGVSILSPNGNAGAMSALSHIAGAAAATLGANSWGFAAIFSFIVNRLNLTNPVYLAGFILAISIVALILFYAMPRERKASCNG